MAGWLVPAGIPWAFYLAFSVPVGLGCAFLYPSVMSCAQKWYAEKKRALQRASSAARWAFPALYSHGWAFSHCAGGYPRRLPLAGRADVCRVRRCMRPCLKTRREKAAAAAAQGAAQNYTVGQMLKTKQYWLLFFVVALATPAVLLFSPIIVELAQQRGLPRRRRSAALWWAAWPAPRAAC